MLDTADNYGALIGFLEPVANVIEFCRGALDALYRSDTIRM